MNCPNPDCGVGEEYLDYWLDNKGIWHWNCFECGREWEVTQEAMEDDIKKNKGKNK